MWVFLHGATKIIPKDLDLSDGDSFSRHSCFEGKKNEYEWQLDRCNREINVINIISRQKCQGGGVLEEKSSVRHCRVTGYLEFVHCIVYASYYSCKDLFLSHTVQIQYFPNADSKSTASYCNVLPEMFVTNVASQVPFSEIFDADRLGWL